MDPGKVWFGIVLVLFLQLVRPVTWFLHVPAPSLFGPFFDSDFRRRAQPPSEVIERSGVQKGMTVLDLGCGSGAFTPSIARAVGPQGKVYALDIQSAMLDQLGHKLARPEYSDLKNVELKLASAYELPFADQSLDLVMLVTALQEIPDKARALREVRRVLKPDGTLAVTEMLPDPDYPMLSTTTRQVKQEGFLMTCVGGSLLNYTARFKKSERV